MDIGLALSLHHFPASRVALASPRFHPMQSRASAGTNRFQHSRFRVPISFGCNDLVFNFDGFYADFSSPAETINGYPYTIEGAVLIVNGVSIPITFSGAQAGIVPDGGSLKSDRVSMIADVTPADTVYIDFCHSVQSGGARLGGLTVQPQNGEFVKSASASLMAELGAVVAGSTVTKRTAFGPTLMAARPAGKVKSVLIWGDSIAVGWEDAGPLADRAQGWPARMLDSETGGRMGVGSIAARGNGLAAASAGGSAGMARRMAALRGFAGVPFSHILCQLGINTVNSATALALDDVKQLFRDAWAYMRAQFPGVPIVQSTLAPLTGVGTTAWTDEAGQTFGNTNVGPAPSILSQINDWIMSGPPEIDGHIVTHISVSGVDMARWKTTGFAATLINAVTAGQANPYRLSVAPVIGTNLVFEPGDGANLDNHADYTVLAVVDGGGGQCDVTLNRSVVKAHAAGTSVGSSITADGTHNGHYGHGLQAAEGASQKAVFG